MKAAVFLDRDGTVTKGTHLITKLDELSLEEKAAHGIKMLNAAGLKVIVATNQPQIARGMCSEEDVNKINQKMLEELNRRGAKIDAVYFCPHHPEMHPDVPEHAKKYRIECECRKPNIGMLKRAAQEFDIDLSKSFMIGDRTVDIQTGKNAGCKAILVRTGDAGNDKKCIVEPDFICDNLADAATLIASKVNPKIKAVILAGGRGERLRPITDNVPKPMIEIGGKPLLQHQIELLKKHGVAEIVLCGSYLVEKIKDYFDDGKDFGVRIHYPDEPHPIGSGGAIRNAKYFLTDAEHFVVLSGDVMTDMNLTSVIDFHLKNNGLATLIVRESDHPKDSDVIEMSDTGRITKYVGRGQEIQKIANTGMMIFNKKIIDAIPEGVSSIEKDVVFKLLDKEPIYGFISTDYIKDVGTFERLESARNHFEMIS